LDKNFNDDRELTDFENLRDSYFKTHDELKQLETLVMQKNDIIQSLEKRCEGYQKQEEIIKDLNELCSKFKKEKEIMQKRYDEINKEKTKLLSNLNTLSLALNMAEGEKNLSMNKVTGVNNKFKKVEKDNHCMKGKVNLLTSRINELEEHIEELVEEVEKERDLRTFYEHKYKDKSAELESLQSEYLLFKTKNSQIVKDQINKINIVDTFDNHNLTTEVSAFKEVSPNNTYYSCNISNETSPYIDQINKTDNITNNPNKIIKPFNINPSQWQQIAIENKENLLNAVNRPSKTNRNNRNKRISLHFTSQGIKHKNMTSLCELLDDQNNSYGKNSSIKKFKVLCEKEESIGKFVLTGEDTYTVEKKNFSILSNICRAIITNKQFENLFPFCFDLQIKCLPTKEKKKLKSLFVGFVLREVQQIGSAIKKQFTYNKFSTSIKAILNTKNNNILKAKMRSWRYNSMVCKTASENSYVVVEKISNVYYTRSKLMIPKEELEPTTSNSKAEIKGYNSNDMRKSNNMEIEYLTTTCGTSVYNRTCTNMSLETCESNFNFLYNVNF